MLIRAVWDICSVGFTLTHDKLQNPTMPSKDSIMPLFQTRHRIEFRAGALKPPLKFKLVKLRPFFVADLSEHSQWFYSVMSWCDIFKDNLTKKSYSPHHYTTSASRNFRHKTELEPQICVLGWQVQTHVFSVVAVYPPQGLWDAFLLKSK